MKKARKIFGVLLTFFGVALSIIFALMIAEGLYDQWKYDDVTGGMRVYPLLLLVGILIVLLGIRLIRKTPVKKDRKDRTAKTAKTASNSVQTAEYKTFRSDPKELFKMFCFVAFVPIVLTTLGMVIKDLDSLRSIIGPVLCILIPFSMLTALIASCTTYRIRVEIGDFGIRFYRGAHMYASYPLDSGFHIAQDAEDMQRFYPIPAILIGLEGQKKKRQAFFGFSDQEFSAAWAELSSLLHEAQAVNQEYQMVQSFTIPKADIKTVMRRKIPQIASVIFLLGEFLVILVAYLYFLPYKEELSSPFASIGIVATIAIAVIFPIIFALRNKHFFDLIPEKIIFGEGWMSVENNRYYASQIKQIRYTAADYCPNPPGKMFYRYLLIDTQGETGTYLLGHKTSAQYQVYQDYVLLVSALYDWCENNDIPFNTIPDPCVSIKTTTQNSADQYSHEL